MPNTISAENLKVYKSLFRAREDVFAIRWEKEGKTGYVPAYNLDRNDFNLHKKKGGSLLNYQNKTYAPLTDEQLVKHLEATHFIGIYPLLKDNTSWFVVADFDGEKWKVESKEFMRACSGVNIPCYLERSRSGNGGHVWIFFEKNYPAAKSRKLVFTLLNFAGIDTSSKNKSFDRIFPNQDFLSSKGLGNLIALPLNKIFSEKGNNCFVDPESLKAIQDQWKFLREVKRVSKSQLDSLLQKYGEEFTALSKSSPLTIILSSRIAIEKTTIPVELSRYIKEQLTFSNSEYWAKSHSGKPTWNTNIRLKYYKDEDQYILLPRGMIGNLLRFCKEKAIRFEFKDLRKKLPEVSFNSSIQLRSHQEIALEATRKKDFGVIAAPPGTGKTVMALAIISEKRQPALIIVHRKQLLEQWQERIVAFLQIPKHEIGVIGNGNYQIGNKITVAIIQSLTAKVTKNLSNSFGIIIVDECHHIPAESFRGSLAQLNSYFLYGITATPFRKHSDEKAIFLYLGDVIAEVLPEAVEKTQLPSLIIRNTSFLIPYDSSIDKFEELSKILVHDSGRNRLIIQDVEHEVTAGRKVILLTERKDHIKTLSLFLRKSFEVIELSGDDLQNERIQKWSRIGAGEFDIIITTGQLFGEGTDLQSIDSLFLVYPFSYEGKLIQYIGRVLRSEIAPVIYDYRDEQIPHLEGLFQRRNSYYKKLYKKGEFKSQEEIVLSFREDFFYVGNSISAIPISCVELPSMIERVRCGIKWRLRILKSDHHNGSLFCEVLNYDYQIPIPESIELLDFTFITKISFRALDTAQLLHVSILKRTNIQSSYKNQTIEKVIKIPLEELVFKHAVISFEQWLDDLAMSTTFDIENEFIRPEFEFLKPYFAKVLRVKRIPVKIKVEYTPGKIINQSAACIELEKINSEIIESLKFRFVSKELIQRKDIKGLTHSLSLEELQANQKNASFFRSEEDLLNYALQDKRAKHGKQLRFLARKHDVKAMKIRFVLEPFSFMFLLTGKVYYHIVWETLNTEEATYIWRIERASDKFFEEMEKIEKAIELVKQYGRQVYLEKTPSNFSRILHDYQDEKKGFMRWKDILEQQLL